MTELTTKDCPFCGEEIKAIAKKCKHCSEMLDENRSFGNELSFSETKFPFFFEGKPGVIKCKPIYWITAIVSILIFFPMGIVAGVMRHMSISDWKRREISMGRSKIKNTLSGATSSE